MRRSRYHKSDALWAVDEDADALVWVLHYGKGVLGAIKEQQALVHGLVLALGRVERLSLLDPQALEKRDHRLVLAADGVLDGDNGALELH